MKSILEDIHTLIVTDPINVRYLSGFIGAAPEEREAYALLTRTQLYLCVSALYLESARNAKCQMPNVKLEIVEISREEPFAKKFAEVLAGLHPDMRLGFEENDLTVAEYHKIMHVHKNVMPVPTQGRVEELRMIKRKDEVKNIRRAAKIADECFECILKKIKPGVSENKIAWEIESFIRSRGVSLAFSPIVAFGRNTSQPHYNTNNKRRPFDSAQGEQNITLQKQDVVLLDFGAKVNGYCSDMTRVVFVGKPKDEWKRAYETVVNAQKKSLEYLQRSHPAWQGETFQERSSAKADRIAREVIAKAGFPAYPHSLGHGVGLDIHEAPRLTIKKDASLKPGMVVTVEPAIYKEGSYGIRIEDLVLLKKDGIELLSKSKKEMTIL